MIEEKGKKSVETWRLEEELIRFMLPSKRDIRIKNRVTGEILVIVGGTKDGDSTNA